jgi:hypothetical protein
MRLRESWVRNSLLCELLKCQTAFKQRLGDLRRKDAEPERAGRADPKAGSSWSVALQTADCEVLRITFRSWYKKTHPNPVNTSPWDQDPRGLTFGVPHLVHFPR